MTDDENAPPQAPLMPQSRITLKAEDGVAQGRFCNFAQIGHQPDAFMLDFAFVQGNSGWLLARMLMSPTHAKRFFLALGDNLARYEASYGEIPSAPTIQ